MRRLLVTIAALVFGCCVSVQGQTPVQWLERMERAERTVSLEGVRVTQFFLPVTTPPIEERIVRSGVRYRVEYLRPPLRRGEVLIDDGVQRFYFVPRLKKVQVFPSEQPLMLRRRQEMVRQLRRGHLFLEAKDAESVAGRDAVLLVMKSAQGIPLRRWWIDREFGVILRMEELTPRGELRMRTEYIRLTIPARVRPDRFAPRFPAQAQQQNVLPPARVFDSVEEAQLLVPFPIRQPRELPTGYRLTEVRLRLIGQRPLVSLHYSDGVSSLALFQTRAPLRDNMPLLRSLSPLSARVERWRDGDLTLVLVGNAPPEVFEQMRKAVR
jgi:negative regulator of sigma E activity